MSVERVALTQARDAAAVAAGLRNAATACTAEQAALRARLVSGATTIDVLAELLIQSLATKTIRRVIR